jgi:hypothetical protein
MQSSDLSADPEPLTIEWNFDGIAATTDGAIRAHLAERVAPAVAATLTAHVNVKYPAFAVGSRFVAGTVELGGGHTCLVWSPAARANAGRCNSTWRRCPLPCFATVR